MFSGIIQGICPVNKVELSPSGLRLGLSPKPELMHGLDLGASIAVNGVCLTVVSFVNNHESDCIVFFDVVPETLKRSNLSDLQIGTLVNIERSLKFGDEVGGHLCSGHVDTLATVTRIQDLGAGAEVDFSVVLGWEKYILEKGYVALNGASLTVANKLPLGFRVAFIPETLLNTNLGSMKVGSKVNLEIDRATQAIVETVERVLEERSAKCS